MREVLLLRWSQAGLVLCGLVLIAIGSGVHIPLLATLVGIVLTAAAAGVIYEGKLLRRGEGDGLFALLLPIAGGLSGVYVLAAGV
ncbi:MAG: hypothetical protein JWM78_3572 [Verrucomicrobiaceae bacterium]|nr:hypothetical protein [Verrucomicrobiaceae bacterium]